ncbi:MAG TPA: class I SAM-dependent methyltransferase [Jiangellaceae bacterium]|nr:class I SAM-dependent methyltransferase [Jiangellaceae bacterium]
MATDQVTDAYGSKAEGLAALLGTVVSADDPDRAVIEPWADTISGRILDVGAGTGRWSGHLASLGHTIEGLEPVEQLVEIARTSHPTVVFRHARIADLVGSEERWAGILAWYSLIHLDPDGLAHALATLRGVLEDRGTILISFFSGSRLEAFSHPATTAYRWPMQRMVRALADAGLEVTARHRDPRGTHADVTAQLAVGAEHRGGVRGGR